MKIIIEGLHPDYDTQTYDPDTQDDLFQVHVMEIGGDGERTACSIDVVHGAIWNDTKEPVTCKKCRSIVLGYKKVKLERG